jgi:hypothetical protein
LTKKPRLENKDIQYLNSEKKILEIQDGSLKSQDSEKTLRIQIQSEVSQKSFYSEINHSRGLSSKKNLNCPKEIITEQKVMALDFFKRRVFDLENDLSNSKNFLGMVVSELRDPISNISH